VTTTNNEFKEKLSARCDRPIEIWPNILDSKLLPDPSPVHLDRDIFHMLAVGRLVRINGIETKGISLIIEAMKSLDDCHLHILGEGPLALEYQAQIERLGIVNRVTLHGYKPRETILGFMKEADILVFPSLTEGLSMTVVESMLMGLSVVTTPVGGQADHIREGENGFLVDRGSSESIAEKVRTIRKNPDILKSVSRAGRIYFDNHFSFEAFARQFEKTVLMDQESVSCHAYPDSRQSAV
jgi:glycosyltransferase involved in cell wall biosynthesis